MTQSPETLRKLARDLIDRGEALLRKAARIEAQASAADLRAYAASLRAGAACRVLAIDEANDVERIAMACEVRARRLEAGAVGAP